MQKLPFRAVLLLTILTEDINGIQYFCGRH